MECIEMIHSISLCLLDTGSVTKKYMVRLLTYLPGMTVATISTNPHILYEIGKLAARLDKTLTEVGLFVLSMQVGVIRSILCIS